MTVVFRTRRNNFVIGIPYRRHSVWRRLREMTRAVIGDEQATVACLATGRERAISQAA